MKMMFFQHKTQYLPRISRIFTAKSIFLMFLGTIGIIGLLFYVVYTIQIPLIGSKNVLGTTYAKKDIRDAKEYQKKEYEHWKQIIAQKPDYLSAYPYLITLAYSLGQQDEARWYYAEVINKDPNNKALKGWKEKLGM